jgi:AraC family transcriptional regulator
MAATMLVEIAHLGSGWRAPGPQVPWRRLPFLLLEWCDAGSWEVLREDQPPVVVPAGRVLAIAADERHAMTAHAPAFTSHWLMLRIECDGRPVDLRGRLPLLQSVATSREILRLLAIAERPTPDLAALLTRSLSLQELARQLLAAAPRPVPVPSPPPARLARVLERLGQQLGEPLTRADLARWAGLSPTRFHAVFHQALGIAPMAYLRTRRLQRACELLTAGDAPVQEIAERCGFPSVHHFSRLFHRTQGCPPTRYRADRQP